ncbi:MAG: DMT family transporter [Promethearchaeota archaeon]
MFNKDNFGNSSDSNRSSLAVILLILTTILWGSTFIITKNMIKEVPIFLFLGLRFLIALIGFTPFLLRLKHINKKIIIFGSIAGLIYFIGMVFQTYGLQTTSAGKAGFITGLNAVIVPFLTWFFFKKPINKRILIAVPLSVMGMALLMLDGENDVIIEDLLVLICAFFFALFIILNNKYVRLIDVYIYTIVQLIVITLLCFLFSILINESKSYDLFSAHLDFWLIIFYMGLIVSTLTFFFQNWSQKYQDPSKTAIIFTLEPVFAVLFASFLIGREILSFQTWIGCGLIFLAIFITVLKVKNKTRFSNNNHYSKLL